jgi:FkbM family methyltransferase
MKFLIKFLINLLKIHIVYKLYYIIYIFLFQNKNLFSIKQTTFLNKRFFYQDNFFNNKVIIKNLNFTNQHFSNQIRILKKIMGKIDYIIDIGSNIGYWSLIYGKHFRSIFFNFEPSYSNFTCLKKNLTNKNNLLYNFGLGQINANSQIGIPKINQNIFKYGNTGFYSINCEKNDQIEKIRIKNFDRLKLLLDISKTVFVKIDVEGYEINVLKGMKKFLQSQKRVYILLEMNIPLLKSLNKIHLVNEIILFLSKNHFNYYMLSEKNIKKLNIIDIIKLVSENRIFDLFAKRIA